MAKKSKVSCFSVKKADPASRSGMIEVLQSLAEYCPVDPDGWHPPLAPPTTGRPQSTMVAGDYGFYEMGNGLSEMLVLTIFIIRSEGALQPIGGEGQEGEDGWPSASDATVAQKKGEKQRSKYFSIFCVTQFLARPRDLLQVVLLAGAVLHPWYSFLHGDMLSLQAGVV